MTNSGEYTKQVPKAARKEYDKGVAADQEGKTEEAIKHYESAIAAAPDFYAAQNNLGTDYMAMTNFQGAQKQFEKVVKLNPSDASAYFNLGNVYLLTKRYVDAKEWVERGLSRQPDSAFGHFVQGAVLTHIGELQQAEIALRRPLELDPIMAKAHLALVNLYLQQQRNEEAVAELKIFVKSFPEDPATAHAKELLLKLGASPDVNR